MASFQAKWFLLLLATSALLEAQEIKVVDLLNVNQRTELRFPPAPSDCIDGEPCVGGGVGGGSVADGAPDPAEFLRSYRGYLQADAYPGYDAMFKNRYGELIEVLCWAHVRRYFYEAQAKDVARATVVLAYVGLLYDVEREARDRQLNSDQRLALRQAKSRPILDDIKNYLEAEKPKVLPKSPIEDAIDYTLKGWAALLWYCQDGDLEIDNNGAERSLRSIVIGRKNWLFYGSDVGGRTGAVLSTLIASCKRQLIDPFAYLRDLFARIAAHPQSRLDELLPDQWMAARMTTCA